MSRFGYRLLLLACVLPLFSVLNGCGGKEIESIPVEKNPALDDIKAGLEDLAESGEISSSVEDIRSSIGNLKGDDEAKIDELMSDLDELIEIGDGEDREKVKAKAKEMLEKL